MAVRRASTYCWLWLWTVQISVHISRVSSYVQQPNLHRDLVFNGYEYGFVNEGDTCEDAPGGWQTITEQPECQYAGNWMRCNIAPPSRVSCAEGEGVPCGCSYRLEVRNGQVGTLYSFAQSCGLEGTTQCSADKPCLCAASKSNEAPYNATSAADRLLLPRAWPLLPPYAFSPRLPPRC